LLERMQLHCDIIIHKHWFLQDIASV
jgi:hypothetical protein